MWVWLMAAMAYPHQHSLDREIAAQFVFSLIDHAAKAARLLNVFDIMLLIRKFENR